MGATSVTGVSGPGSVDGMQKGSEHMSLGVSKLIGPRVYLAGQKALDASGNATVTFPTISDSIANYLGFATDTHGTAAAVNVTSLATGSIVLKGTASHTVNYLVVKIH